VPMLMTAEDQLLLSCSHTQRLWIYFKIWINIKWQTQ